MTVTITLLNQKGGVGKTSTAFHLGGTLAAHGRRVLLLDNDPQCSLTQGFHGPSGAADVPPDASLAAAYGERTPFLESLARPTAIANLDLVPGSWALADANHARPEARPAPLQQSLEPLLSVDAAEMGYEFVLIDCPPNLHLLSWAALLASDYLIVPMQAEDFGAQGLAPVLDFHDRARRHHPAVEVLGLLITMLDRRARLPREYEALIRAEHGDAVFKSVVPRLIDFPEAVNRHRPVSHYRTGGQAAGAMRCLADELLDRIAARTPAAVVAGEGGAP